MRTSVCCNNVQHNHLKRLWIVCESIKRGRRYTNSPTPQHTRTHTQLNTVFLFHQFSLESHTWQHGRQLLQRCQRTTGVQTADTGRSQHWPTPSIYDKDCQIRHNVSFCIVCQVFLCCSAILPAEFQQSWGGKVNSCVWLFGFVFFWHLAFSQLQQCINGFGANFFGTRYRRGNLGRG